MLKNYIAIFIIAFAFVGIGVIYAEEKINRSTDILIQDQQPMIDSYKRQIDYLDRPVVQEEIDYYKKLRQKTHERLQNIIVK